MNDELNDISPADRELEAALKSLRPAQAAIPVADTLFEAGRRAAVEQTRKQLRIWRGLAVVLAIVAGQAAFFPRAQVVEQRTVIVAADPAHQPVEPIAAKPTEAAEPLAAESMLSLRQVAMEKGVDHLPLPRGGRVRFLQLRDARDLSIP
jgi:hypothetical protein